MQDLRASEIREILKLTQDPEVISFAGGLPAQELFPVQQMIEAGIKVLETEKGKALQYSTTEGYYKLRTAIAERMNNQGATNVTAEKILITSGSQQGLDLTGKVFLDEGDVILCESPTYLGAINAFKAYRPRFREVPTDEEGMIIPELERMLAEIENVKVIYVIPDFQNPSGRTWSMARRRAFMELVNRVQVPVVEDAPYTELRFEGEAMPSLKSMDTDGLVIYLGTFSKILFPGVRIGWLVADQPFYEKFVLVKQGADLHTSTLSQRQIWTFMQEYSIEENVARMLPVYRSRRDVMLETMERVFPEGASYSRPHGGLFFWVILPKECNSRELLRRSIERKVAFVPGGSFFPNGGNENTMRLNFSAMPEEKIKVGIERLAIVIKEFLAECCPQARSGV
jgi:DNA-binding transcriptional MocR family regulator